MYTFTRLFALLLFSLFSVTGCKKADNDVTPAATKVWIDSYFSGYYFDPKELDDDETRLLIKFCSPVDPADTEIGIYEFSPGTNLDDALGNLLVPHYDDDGEVIDRAEPDYFIQVHDKYVTPEGVKLSDFNKDKEFVIDIDRNSPSIITYEDKNGILQYVTVDPLTVSRENPPHLCLKGS